MRASRLRSTTKRRTAGRSRLRMANVRGPGF
jgi:hypothetical protein